MTVGIYRITNKKTGQIYIGKSINIEKRFKEHIRGDGCPNSRIDNAIQKYGKDYFKFEIIEEFNKDTPSLDDVLNDSEQYYIATYNTFQNDFHYNLTIGGDGVGSGENHPCYGKPLSEKTKKKMSKALSGENNPNYGKTGENHPCYGKPLTKEHKKKISEANTGKKLSEETKKKISETNKGKYTGENNPMYGKTGEHHPRYGKKHSEESKKKISESLTKKYARIIKMGKNSNNKQIYSIKYQGKRIKRSVSIDKLKQWFAKNYPGEELRCEIE